MIYVDAPTLSEHLTAEGKKLYSAFVKSYGEIKSTELIFATSFEGFRALHGAIQFSGDPRTYLHTTTFNGIAGPWRFDKDGDIMAISFVMKKIVVGVPVRYEP